MINQLNYIPLVRLLAPFIVGIIAVMYVDHNYLQLLYFFGATVALLFILLLIKKNKL